MRTLLVALALLPRLALAAPPEAAQEAHREGMRLAKAGQTAEAVAELEKAVRLDPGFAEAWADLGNTELSQGRLPEAVKALESAVKLRPELQVARYNLAYALRKSKQHRRAADEYRLYLQREPDDPDANYGLAESLRASGDDLAAAEAYDTYARVEKRSGQAKWIAKASELAAELRAKAKDAPPPPPQAATRATRVEPARARREEPAPTPRAAEEKKKPHLSFTRAEPVPTEAAASAAEPAPLATAPAAGRSDGFERGLIALKSGDYAGALPGLSQAARDTPQDRMVWAALASAHLGLRQANEAAQAYRRALDGASPEAEPGLWLGLGEALRLGEDRPGALAAYQKARTGPKASEAVKRLAEERAAALRD